MDNQYFVLLGCTQTTPLKEIEKKYKKLMRKTHPDRGHDDKLCKQINEAYQHILDYKINNLFDSPTKLVEINSIQYIKRISLSNKKYLLESNADTVNTDTVNTDTVNDDTFLKFGDNEIETTFRKNLLTSKIIYEYEGGILENIFNYFF